MNKTEETIFQKLLDSIDRSTKREKRKKLLFKVLKIIGKFIFAAGVIIIAAFIKYKFGF
jgi:hypothetical protein